MTKRIRKKQLKKQGAYINPKETWNLDYEIAKYVRPRLVMFKKLCNGYPAALDSPEEWDKILDKMIVAFSLLEEKSFKKFEISKEEQQKMNEGMELFVKHIGDLWW